MKEMQLDLFMTREEIERKSTNDLSGSMDSLRRGLFLRLGKQAKQISSMQKQIHMMQVEIDRLNTLTGTITYRISA